MNYPTLISVIANVHVLAFAMVSWLAVFYATVARLCAKAVQSTFAIFLGVPVGIQLGILLGHVLFKRLFRFVICS